jgi:hypothetical protein
VIPYASYTGNIRNQAAIRAAGWRILITATDRHSPPAGIPFAIDNGAWSAFQQNTEFNTKRFLIRIEKFGALADFVVVPDIVAGGMKSLEFSLSWIPRLRHLKLLLLPVQDGMEFETIADVLREIPRLGIFLGGTTEWKLKTMYAWGVLACASRRYYHVARVNTRRRIRLAAESGADSFDGSSVSRYAVTMPLLDAARKQPSLLVPSTTLN